MKKFRLLFIACALIASTAIHAQIKTPQPSPVCTVSQIVGLADVEVEYSRPGMKGRTIFGGLLSYGEMWRLGANASTKFRTSEDITVGGLDVPAGEYALYAIPHEKAWELVFHKDLSLWGTGGYDAANDLGTIKATTNQTTDACETLTIDFANFTTAGADMLIKWENTEVVVPIKTSAVKQVEEQINKVLVEGPGASDYAAGARFYLDQGTNLEQALTWIDQAIEGRPDAFWYVHNKAEILGKLGKTKEAIAAAEMSMKMARSNEEGDYGYISNNEKLIKELTGKK